MARNRSRDMRPCRNCGTDVYWTNDYCEYCLALPERWCFGCERMTHTDKAECQNCDKPFGRLTFGFDRLSDTPVYGRKSQNERIGGWTDKTPHPDAVWHAVAETGWRNGVQMVTPWPVFKAKAPGIGWPAEPPTSGPSTAWYRAVKSEVNWYSCGRCGVQFGPGDGHKTVRMVNPGYGFGDFNDGPTAHEACKPLQWEIDARKAAYLAQSCRNEARREDALRRTVTTWVPEKGPVVNGEQFAPGYTFEAAMYEQSTRG